MSLQTTQKTEENMTDLITTHIFQGTTAYDLEWELKDQMRNLENVKNQISIVGNNSNIQNDYIDTLVAKMSEDFEFTKKTLQMNYENRLSTIRAIEFGELINNVYFDDMDYSYALFDREEDEWSYNYELSFAYDYYFCSHIETLSEGQKIFEDTYELHSLDVYKQIPKEGNNDSESVDVMCRVQHKITGEQYVVTDLCRFLIELRNDNKLDYECLIRYIDFINHVESTGDFFPYYIDELKKLSISDES